MLDLEPIKKRRAAFSNASWRAEFLYVDRREEVIEFITHAPADIDDLIAQAEKDRYAMARALLYLRQTHDHDEWYNEDYVVAEVINLLINVLGTRDIRAILEKRDGTD